MTVDGGSGKIYAGALEIEAPDESDHEALAQLTRLGREDVAASRRFALRAAKQHAAVDLSTNDDAADPEKIGQVLKGFKGARGARGGVVASDEGVRAALKAGLEFIVAEPVLPPLLAAVRAAEAGATLEVEDT